MEAKRKVVWVGDTRIPQNLAAAVADGWDLAECALRAPLAAEAHDATIVAIGPDGAASDARWLEAILEQLDRTPAVGVFLLPADAQLAWSVLSRRTGQFLCVREDASPEELRAKLAAAAALQPTIRNLQAELAASRQINADPEAAAGLDEEMRLASRLQRDFLPRRMPEVGPVRFSVLYRPATWVSGDIYDVTRLDETHVGFYVADAVGHGMPAALLTIFIKKALQTKRIAGNTYEIIPPHVSLAALNGDIYEQNLSSCQFCTAIYCVVDTAALVLTYARAGHPEAVLLRADGDGESLQADGSLLGVFPDEQFELRHVQLYRGDRLVLYSDGAEEALCGTGDERRPFRLLLAEWAGASREEMFAEMLARIEAGPRPQRPRDDVTVLVMDVE